MKALTLWQPWASLVRPDTKTIESRSWATLYRGPLLIHAAVRWDNLIRAEVARARRHLHGLGLPPLPDDLPTGAVVAIAILADCWAMDQAPDPVNEIFGCYGPDRFGWILEDIRVLPRPIPWSGSQGLWSVPLELEARVRVTLAGEAVAS
jgi:hypothetical protein